MLKATFNCFVLEIYVTDNNTRKGLNLRAWLRIIAYLPRWYTLVLFFHEWMNDRGLQSVWAVHLVKWHQFGLFNIGNRKQNKYRFSWLSLLSSKWLWWWVHVILLYIFRTARRLCVSVSSQISSSSGVFRLNSKLYHALWWGSYLNPIGKRLNSVYIHV